MRFTIERTEEFGEWLSSLSPKFEALVRARLTRIRDDGHFGNYRILGDGLVELKWANGLRVYFIRVGENKVRVLLGGLKNGQKKTSKGRGECFDDIPIVAPSKTKRVKRFDPESKLRDRNFVAKALFEALSDGDEAAALEIIIAYIEAVKKSEIAKKENLAPSTVYHALSPNGNPTLKTLARVLHAVRS